MIYLLAFFVEISLLFEMRRRLNAFSAGALICTYIIVAQVFFLYKSIFFDDSRFSAGSFGTFYFRPEFGIAIYFAIFFLVYASSLGVRQRHWGEFPKFRDIPMKRATKVLYAITAMSLALRLFSIDWGALWENHVYLYLNSFDVLVWKDPISRINRSLYGMLSAITGALATYHYVCGRKKMALIGVLLFSPVIVFEIIRSSRSAAVPLFAVMIVLLVFGNRFRHRLAALGVLLLIGIFLISAIYGRAQGNFGLSSFFQQFGWISNAGDMPILDYTLGSVSQGIFVTADSISLDATFSERYKILSFSPFPSSLDGFREILETDQVRLHAYVPMSAVGEAFHFGTPYLEFFALFLMFLIRQNARLSVPEQPIIFLITSVMLVAFFIAAQTYPIRNVFKQFLIILLLLNYRILWAPVRQVLVQVSRQPR